MRSLAAALLLTVLAVPVAAQQTTTARALPSELRDGRWALSFGASLGGGFLGYTNMTSSRTAFTLDLSASGGFLTGENEEADTIVSTRESAQVFATIQPGLRWYGRGRGDVASYVGAHLILGVEGYYNELQDEDDVRSSQSWAPVGGIGAGIGLEWFVTDALSLRGEIGASADYSYRYSERVDLSVEQTREHSVRGRIGTTGLAATLWF